MAVREREQFMEDIINGFDINSKGYGTIPKTIMQDRDLHVCAKAIYAYFCSYTGSGNVCFPSRDKICYDLHISADTFTKYLQHLTKKGYLKVEQIKEKGKFSRNVYTLLDTISPCTKITVSEIFGHGSLDTKNNSIKNNSILKNNSINNITVHSENEQKKIPSNEGTEIHNHTSVAVHKSSTKANVNQYQNEFEKLWKQYPNKKGKPKALGYYIKARKAGASYEDVEKGIVNYIKEIKIRKTELRYIKNGSTWFYNHCWEDEYATNTGQNKNSANKDYSGGWD